MERRRGDIRAAVLLSLLAAGLTVAPSSWGTAARLALRDALAPGLTASKSVQDATVRFWDEVRPGGADAPVSRQRIAALEEEVRSWQEQCRRQQVANAQLVERVAEVQRQGVLPWPVAESQPLVVPELVEATVLAPQSGQLWPTDALLDKGHRDGMHDEQIVLAAGQGTRGEGQGPDSDPRPVIDQGEATGLSDGQAVFAGRCVVGRLTDVGRVVSVVQPVTDPAFRGLARLVRRTDDGFAFGAEGILAGTGRGDCVLRHVPATEPVAVGDEVYTSGRDDPGGHPMYYGRVVHAELDPDGQTWTIRVSPAVTEVRGRVTVVRQRVNPLRTAAN